MRFYFISPLFILSILAACTTFQHRTGSVAKRAPFDLKCPAENIKYSELGVELVGAEGCGNRATYRTSCNSVGDCSDAELEGQKNISK